MTVRDDIRRLLADGPARTAHELADALGVSQPVVRLQLGGMRASGEADEANGLWTLTGVAPQKQPRRRRAPEPEVAAEPVRFGVAVWHDGCVTIVGAQVGADGTVCLCAEDAGHLYALLRRALPPTTEVLETLEGTGS